MPATVRATQAAVLHLDGLVVAVREGEPFPENDPVVKAHPWLFRSDADRDVELGNVVEQATAAPGERRRTR